MKVKYNNQNISNTGFAPTNTYLKTELKIRKKKRRNKKGKKIRKKTSGWSFPWIKIEAIKILFFVYLACNAKDSLPAKSTRASVKDITDDGYKTQEVTITKRPTTIFPI